RSTLIEDADDVRVIKLGERLRLIAPVGRNFQGDQPLHRCLPSEKHASESAFAKLDEQIEVFQLLAGSKTFDSSGTCKLRRGREVFASHQPAKRLGRAGKPLVVFAGSDRLPCSASNVILLIDQVARRLAVFE